jgi:DNA primase
MNRRFTDEELYNVRNRIPIRHVIETLLAIPSETVRGVFRFRCPLCAGRHTAINPETNLSRCFDCEKNFNTIDLCMRVRHTDFVESVKFLIGQKGRLAEDGARTLSGNHRKLLESQREENKTPVALGDILAKLTYLRATHRQIGKGIEEDQKDANGKRSPHESSSLNDIAELEHIVHALSQILQRLKSNHNPS